MEAKQRGRPRNAHADTAILEAARDLMTAEGYERMTIEAIAARAGVGKQTVYRRWPSKAAIVAEAVMAGHLGIRAEAPPQTGDAAADLSNWLGQFFRQLGEPAAIAVIRGLAAAATDGGPDAEKLYERFTGPSREQMLELLRAGVERILTDAGHEVVASVADASNLLDLVEETAPDLVIVDVRMPPTFTDEGIRAAALLRDRNAESPVLVLSHYVEERYASDLITSDTRGFGYLLKDRVADVPAFLDAVSVVGSGGRLVARCLGHQPLVRDMVDHYRMRGERFDYTVEERWVREEGYGKIIPEAVSALFQSTRTPAAQVTRAIFPVPASVAQGLCRKLGLETTVLVDADPPNGITAHHDYDVYVAAAAAADGSNHPSVVSSVGSLHDHGFLGTGGQVSSQVFQITRAPD